MLELFAHPYVSVSLFTILAYVFFCGRKHIRTFVRWRRRPTQPRHDIDAQPGVDEPYAPVPVAPSVVTTESATPAPAEWWWKRWWERRKAERETRRKARLEELKKMREGALLLEVETKRRIEAIFLFFLLPVAVVVTLLYFAPEIAGFLGKVKTSGMVGSYELPEAVVKAREWMMYKLQIPTVGFVMAVFIIIVYALFLLESETSLFFFFLLLLAIIVGGVWFNHYKGVNIFLIPANRDYGVVDIPLAFFVPAAAALGIFFAVKEKPDAIFATAIVLCLAIFL